MGQHCTAQLRRHCYTCLRVNPSYRSSPLHTVQGDSYLIFQQWMWMVVGALRLLQLLSCVASSGEMIEGMMQCRSLSLYRHSYHRIGTRMLTKGALSDLAVVPNCQ